MKILILISSMGRLDKDVHHVDAGINYVQYVSPFINKPEDISKIKWDVAIIDRNLKLSENEAAKWIQALNIYCSMVVQLY